MEHGVAKEQMRGKWPSSCFDFGYTKLLCIPDLTSETSRLVTVFLGTLWCSIKKIEATDVFNKNTILLCTKCREIKPHLPARDMCHGISRVAAGIWGIFSSYSGDGHSKFHFVQRRQESCVVMRDNSGI